MDLRVLNYYLTVAREENITKAAKLLHVTQPTLSRQLRRLEEELGVKLFDRASHNIVLTGEGRLLKRRAQELLGLAEKTRMELAQSEGMLTGTISVGSGELRSVDELAGWIARFREAHPLVAFEVYSGAADSIRSQMEEGALDLGLLLEPTGASGYECIRMRTREEWCALVPKDSPLAAKGFVTPEDAGGRPLFLPAREPVRSLLFSWLGGDAAKLKIAAMFNLLYNAAVMAKKTGGIALALRLDCSYEGLAFAPLRPALTQSSVLAWKERQVFAPAATAFIRFAQKCSKGIE